MGRTIGELMDSMSSQEFSVWIELYKEDEWGESRLDLRAGVVAATIGNFAGKVRKEHAGALTAAEFFPGLTKAETPKEVDPITFFSAVAASKTFNK